MENKKYKTLALFGDSIMYGSGNGGVGVGEYLCELTGANLLKYCVGGARVGYYGDKNWLVEQVRKAVTDKILPDLVIFDGFTNDCNMSDGVHCDVPLGERGEVKDIFSLGKMDNFTVCFESILSALKAYFNRARIVFVRPHKMGRRDERAQKDYGERAVEICRDYGAAVADIYGGGLDTFDSEMRDLYTADTYGWGRGDATHPNAAGYEKFYIPEIMRLI